jgi:hypothetical protein
MPAIYVLKTIKKVHRYCKNNYTYLLVALITLFATRPHDAGLHYLELWKFGFTLAFIGVVFNCEHPFIVKVIAIGIGIPALILGWISLYQHSSFFIVGSFVLIQIFMFMCVFSLLYYGVLQAPPSFGGLYPMICAYFMVGYAFSYTYMLIEYLFPGSFEIANFTYDPAMGFQRQYLEHMLYYGLGTLMIVGVPDVTAVGFAAQTIFIMNSMAGQFYIAILVARLISLSTFLQHRNHMLVAQKHDARTKLK